MRSLAPPAIRHPMVATLCLLGIFFSAPWPSVQGILHAILVLGLAPQANNLLAAGLWSAAAGWILEGTLRIYPHLGGTPWADLSVTLLTVLLLKQWPPERMWIRWGQLGGLVMLQTAAVHLAVRIACGPHPWGSSWLWALLTIPAWGTLVHRFQARPYGK